LKKALIILPVAVLLLAGCGGSPQSSPTPPTVDPAGANNASSSPTAAAATGAKSSRGNLVKKVGEGASVTDKDKTVASFVINSITVDPQCTAKSAQPAKNGHFVALDVSMETSPELAQSVNPKFGLSHASGWKDIADNGTTFNGDLRTLEAIMCFDSAERFPSDLGPGEKATGKIVLDVPTPMGVLVQRQGFMLAGWEWEYPAK
jgi:hypothetical protein